MFKDNVTTRGRHGVQAATWMEGTCASQKQAGTLLNAEDTPLSVAVSAARKEGLPPPPPPPTSPRGVFLHGDVGAGKTLVLDLFASGVRWLDQGGVVVRRVHFNAFLTECHRRLHAHWHTVHSGLKCSHRPFGVEVFP